MENREVEYVARELRKFWQDAVLAHLWAGKHIDSAIFFANTAKYTLVNDLCDGKYADDAKKIVEKLGTVL